MIQSFADEPPRKVWDREYLQGLGPDLQHMAQKKLRLLNAAETVNDMRVPVAAPSNVHIVDYR